MDKKTYEQAIKEINETMKEMEDALHEGDLNHEQFYAVLNHYTKGVILRARLQAGKTIRSNK